MKKILTLLPIVAVLTACGSTDVYEKRADKARERQEKFVERSIDKAPKWMTELPKSTGAVYANGTAVSGDFAFADEKAKTMALGKICMSAGGEVDKQSRVYMNDTTSSTNENSETAVRSLCRKVDVTGAEIVEIKRIAEGSRVRTYVLMALPMGDANQLKKAKVDEATARLSATRATEAFKELDTITVKPVQ
jgi:uncharacterized protein with beta-barrel porin domain